MSIQNRKTIVSNDGLSKTCTKCGEMQLASEFHVLKRGVLGRNVWCKSCMNTARAKWASDNREHTRTVQKAYYENNRDTLIVKGREYRITAYGITVEQYNQMIVDGCYICGSHTDLHIDHDHSCCPPLKSCGKCVRGILCALCNRGIGHFKEDVTLMQRAIDYILDAQ